MPWVDGVYVPNRRAETTGQISPPSNPIVRMDLKTDSIDNDFFDESILTTKFSTGAFTASVLKRLLPTGVISAANGLRALFSSGFVNSDLIENGAVTGAKITNPLRVALIDGGGAGTHTVAGIKINDELISVLEQNGTSGLLTDLTTEFSIVKADTISNIGGTATSGDKLVVLYLSK
jgi:hypothetical protein|tara:strand:+ start:806 stop:1336 length:531 start_codon:yes stop_codon:yes gene_type:complete